MTCVSRQGIGNKGSEMENNKTEIRSQHLILPKNERRKQPTGGTRSGYPLLRKSLGGGVKVVLRSFYTVIVNERRGRRQDKASGESESARGLDKEEGASGGLPCCSLSSRKGIRREESRGARYEDETGLLPLSAFFFTTEEGVEHDNSLLTANA